MSTSPITTSQFSGLDKLFLFKPRSLSKSATSHLATISGSSERSKSTPPSLSGRITTLDAVDGLPPSERRPGPTSPVSSGGALRPQSTPPQLTPSKRGSLLDLPRASSSHSSNTITPVTSGSITPTMTLTNTQPATATLDL